MLDAGLLGIAVVSLCVFPDQFPEARMALLSACSLLIAARDAVLFRVSTMSVTALAVASFGTADAGWAILPTTVATGVALAAFLLFLGMTMELTSGRKGIGLGDVKLAFSVGLWLRVDEVGLWLLASAVGGVSYAGLRIWRKRRRSPHMRVPFATFMVFSLLALHLAHEAPVP